MKHLKTESIILAIGLIIMGECIREGLSSISEKDRCVNVKGLSEKEVEADVVTWPIAYKILGNDLSQIYSDIQKDNKVIIDFLKEKGLDDREIIVNTPDIIDLKAERYTNMNNIQHRYNITSVITVKSKKIETVRQLISEQSELLKRGIATVTGYEYKVVYEYTGLNRIKPIMIEEATKNARITAQRFAIDSNSKLGKIQNANQGQFSITNSDETTPHIKRIRVVTSITYTLED